MKNILCFVFSILVLNAAFGQKLITKSGTIGFDASGKLEKIQALNKKVVAALDKTSGQLEFAVLMKSFEFEKALMEEHFNDNYVESDKYPKATFKGKISNIKDINWSKDGKYAAQVSGSLTIHGATKQINSVGTFEVIGNAIHGKSEFQISLKDYNIAIPSLVKENINDKTKLTIDIMLSSAK